jgi:glycosyltransferase involved in cell wall biosynthesis
VHLQQLVYAPRVGRVRLAVFTNEFPTDSTFFARDIRALLERNFAVDIFPIRPIDARLWKCVPDGLTEHVLPRDRVHDVSLRESARFLNGYTPGRVARFARDAVAITSASLNGGPVAVAKSVYAAVKGWAWARQFSDGGFDHVLAYWGNYAATAAYVFHRLTDSRVPFSMIVHARIDLYQTPVFLAEKMLYADNVFVVCEFNRGYLQRTFPKLFPRLKERIHIHHLGLDLTQTHFSPLPRPPARLVSVGRLEELKGVHVLLQAVKALRGRGISAEVELIGVGDWEGKLRALAAELGIAAQVAFRGWMRPDQVLDAMRQATVLVHPSIMPDAMPTVLKEALAVGTPVIASDLAGIPEILDHGRCGVLVPAGDVGALADAIAALLRDEARRREYATVGRQHAERLFDLRRTGQRLAEQLRSTPRRNGMATSGSVAR